MKKFRIIKYLGVSKENIFKFCNQMFEDFEIEVIEEFDSKKDAKTKFNEIKESGSFTDSMLVLEGSDGDTWHDCCTYTEVK